MAKFLDSSKFKKIFPQSGWMSVIFMQAFPAGSGPQDRTTYMFTYVDPQSVCPKLEELLESYWDLMPEYQVSSSVSDW